MTTNFKILHDYGISDRYIKIQEKVQKIENSILENNFDYIYLEGRKILELLFSKEYADETMSLNEKIINFTTMNIVPTKPKNAFFNIKNKGNEDGHTLRASEIPFEISKDIHSSIEFLKHVFIAIKFFIKNENKLDWSDAEDKGYNFDSGIYMTTINNKNETNTKEDVEVDSQTLTTKTRGIFALLSTEYNFLIPTYQRSYSWKEENVEIFLQDIKDRVKDKTTHYMGSLAIAIDDDNSLLRLIDGQQRITTSLLLLKVIIDRYKASKILKMPKELEELSTNISNKYINAAGPYGELNHVKSILAGNITKDKGFLKSVAYKNYMIIVEFINKINAIELDEFYTTFVLYFVVSELNFSNDLANEIIIFENLNSKGLELSQWDLIKNYIYKQIDIDFLIKDEKQIESILNELFVIPSIVAFGSDKKYDQLSDFFVYHSRISVKLTTGKILSEKGKIHKVFAKTWPEDNIKFSSLKDLRKALMPIAREFFVYSEIRSKNFRNSNSKLFYFWLPLENTFVKDAQLPLFINAIISNSEWSGKELLKITNKEGVLELFNAIEKYLIRLLVVSNKGQSLSTFFDDLITNDFPSIYKNFISKIKEQGTQNSITSHKSFVDELKNKNDWQKEYALSVLRTIEYQRKNQSGRRVILEKPSLEHIFPQKPKKDSKWVSDFGKSYAKFSEKHAVKVNKLGNYVILSQPLNSKAKNYDFSIKLKEYKKDSTSLLLNGDVKGELMNLLLKDSFAFNDIDVRSKQLSELASPLYRFEFDKK